jgi:hypothetical protein
MPQEDRLLCEEVILHHREVEVRALSDTLHRVTLGLSLTRCREGCLSCTQGRGLGRRNNDINKPFCMYEFIGSTLSLQVIGALHVNMMR